MAQAADHFKRRVTDIYCAADLSFGSGFLLGNAGLVLTARHVLDPRCSGTMPPSIKARPIGCPGREWLPATLVWPANPADLANQKLDAALIRIDPWPHAEHFSRVSRIGVPDDQDGDEVKATAIGFPKFAEDKNVRDTEEVALAIRTGTGMVTGSYKVVDQTFTQTKRDARADWHGFSGAALLYQGQVIGLVITRKVGEQHDFGAVRMQDLLAAPGFRAAAGNAVLDEQPSETAPPPKFADLTCLLGRDLQEEDFEDLYTECVSRRANRTHARAMLCLVPGADVSDHCPEDLAKRFALRTLPRRNWPRFEFTWLTWPARTDIEPGLKRLRSNLWGKLCSDTTKEAPAEAAAYSELLERGRPRLFQSDLTGRGTGEDLAKLVVAWSEFWGRLSCLSDGRPPIHLLLVKHPDPKATLEWLGQLDGSGSTVVAALPSLDECSRLELRQWLDERLSDHVEEHWRRRLDLALTVEYGIKDRFKMLHFRNDVARMNIGG